MTEENKDCWLAGQCNHCDCDRFCLRRYKLDYLYNEANVPLKQRWRVSLRPDRDNTDRSQFVELKKIEDGIEGFIERGENLYIHSTVCGNGKTSWALRLVQAHLNSIWFNSDLSCRALFIHVPTFLLAIKENISNRLDYVQHIKDNMLTADIVVWDDIGNKSSTQFESDTLLSMIDGRLSLGKSNVFTSNLNSGEMHECLGDRLTSRIINKSIDIELKGMDKRGL